MSRIIAVLLVALAVAVPLIYYADQSGDRYRARPCPAWADRPINEVPARCAEYFGVITTTENGDQ